MGTTADGRREVTVTTTATGSPTRRAALRALTVLVALTASAVLAGCGVETLYAPDLRAGDAAPSATATPEDSTPEARTPEARTTEPAVDNVAPGTLVMIIRHAEKPEDGAEPGFDANGVEDDSSLTKLGWERAHRLVDLFDPAQGDLRAGLARPTTIYAAHANENGEGQRTRETVKPLADRLGVPVNTDFGKGDGTDLVEHVLSQPGPTLISWQHSEIPDIADAFPSVTPAPPAEWPDDRYDVIWTLTKTADGWRFAQLPELALPQDQATPIEG
jgi:broad specificity phosphatase PhoE